jgi:uncharacterized protein
MDRRHLVTAAIGTLGLCCATPPIDPVALQQVAAEAKRVADAEAAAAERPKVAYHLSDFDKADFVLGNIHNHYAGMGGPGGVTIELVVHGPALKAFHRACAAPDIAKRIEELCGLGLKPFACINTMRAENVTVDDLLPGFAVADKGSVVRLAQLQSQGYAYLRP